VSNLSTEEQQQIQDRLNTHPEHWCWLIITETNYPQNQQDYLSFRGLGGVLNPQTEHTEVVNNSMKLVSK
jgi:hypothetical protein